MTCKNDMKFEFYHKQFYSNIVLIHLGIVYGCFCTTASELSSCNKDSMASKV